jgi:hypothetical protein
MPIVPIRKKWKSTMTDRQRFYNQMHYLPTDRCFNMEFGYWQENFTTWQVFIDNNVKSHDDGHALFNLDVIKIFKGSLWLEPDFGNNTVIEETGTTKIVMNRDGLTAEVPKDGHDTIPHYIKSSINNSDDWKRIKEERFQIDIPARKVDVETLKKMHPADRDYPLGIDCGSMIGKIRDMLTFEGVAYAIYDYPEILEDMVETCCRLVEHTLDQMLGKIDFDYASGWEDICFKSGPIVSMDFFKNVVVPRYKRINKKLKAHGIDIWYTDCDGDVRPILPLLLESGINCLLPFEVNCCTHPGRLLDEYGKDLRIMGGFDKMALGEGREAIKKYMKSLAPYVERGGYIPFCDHRCPPNVKQEDYFYYLDLKEQMFGMKK